MTIPTINDELLSLPDVGDWDILAAALKTPVQDLKNMYANAIDEYIKKPSRIRIDELPEPHKITGKFDINKSYTITVVPATLVVRVDVGITTQEDWSGTVRITPIIFGKELGASEIQISRTQSFFQIHPSALLVKADLKIGIYGDNLCFGIEGQACYWGFGWKCQDFNKQNLFCIK